MKRIIAVALLTLSTFGASNMFAQDRAVKADVPFGFSVGEKYLPADTYIITSTISGVVLVRSVNGGPSAMTLSLHGEAQTVTGSKLIFTKYGDRYFLHNIVSPQAVGMNVDLPTSKLEKRLRREGPAPNNGEVAFLEIK